MATTPDIDTIDFEAIANEERVRQQQLSVTWLQRKIKQTESDITQLTRAIQTLTQQGQPQACVTLEREKSQLQILKKDYQATLQRVLQHQNPSLTQSTSPPERTSERRRTFLPSQQHAAESTPLPAKPENAPSISRPRPQ